MKGGSKYSYSVLSPTESYLWEGKASRRHLGEKG